MPLQNLRRRVFHDDIDGRSDDSLNEPLLGDYTVGYSDRSQHDIWKDKKTESLHWSFLFNQLIAQWAQWLGSIIAGSGSRLGRILTIPFQNGQSYKISPSYLNPLQKERLRTLRQRMEISYDGDSVDHQNALIELWKLAYPDKAVPPLKSEPWKDMGWQGCDPSTDFRGGGFISLENLIFFAKNYPESFQRLLLKQEGNRSEWEYPFAVGGVNISFMLTQMLDLQSDKPTSSAGCHFLKLLEHDQMAFDNLYCVAFKLMDAKWLSKNATYMEFNDVLKSTRTQLERELSLENLASVQNLPSYNMLNQNSLELQRTKELLNFGCAVSSSLPGKVGVFYIISLTMLSTKEDEANEKVVRGLLKLPTNRNCFNCNSPAPPQFVCTSFLTFVCITCSGIHREFMHRVKSISMAKFTKEEVQALEKGGNQRARELYLNKWDMKNKKLPNSGNLDGIREFIKDVYVLKKYFSSHKSPGDKQGSIYDPQYKDRCYEKLSGIQTRTGSDSLSNNMRLMSLNSRVNWGDPNAKDSFSNEGSGRTKIYYTVSNTSKPIPYEGQSQKFVNKIPHLQSTVSWSNFGSSNSIPAKSFSSTSLFDVEIKSEHPSGTQIQSPQSYSQTHAPKQDPFGLLSVEQSTVPTPHFIDLFSEVNHTPPAISSTPNTVQVPFSQNKGWATFDMPKHDVSNVEPKNTSYGIFSKDEISHVNFDTYSTKTSSSDLLPMQSPTGNKHISLMTDQWNLDSLEPNESLDPSSSAFWSEFDRSAGKSSQPIESSSLKTDSNVTSDEPNTLVNPYSGLKIPEDSGKYHYHRMTAGGESLIQSNTPFGYDVGPRIPWPKFPVTEEKTYKPKSVNPFDSPCEPDLGHGISLEMSSLHASLPNPPFETPFLSVPRPLFPWDDPTYMQGQQPSPQLTGQAAHLDQGIHFHR